MPSPFPQLTSIPGHGSIHLTFLPPSTPTFSRLNFTYPLKLVPSVPHKIDPLSKGPQSHPPENDPTTERIPAATTCPLLFMLTYGGGLLAGDSISMAIKLDAGTRLTITTQGMTKIYRPPRLPLTPSNPNPVVPSSQTLNVRVRTHAVLWLAPDPVQPFADSHYTQVQVFEVERKGSVGLVDWVIEGRKARGESWSLGSWRGRNEIWGIYPADATLDENCGEKQERKELLVRDAVVLEQPGVKKRMDNVGVFGTILLRGPLFGALADFFVKEFALLPRVGGRNWSPTNEEEEEKKLSAKERWRKKRVEMEKVDGVLWTACHVRGCTVVKFMAPEVEGARHWLASMLKEDETVQGEFGEGGLMFVR
ncbi:MAG: hypothetical protein Q9164_000042 [Protoblastenia rupestris]